MAERWPAAGVEGGDLGGGFSAPSIVGGRLFGMSNRGSDEVVWALSETNGKEVWGTRLGPAYRGQGMQQGSEGPGATPTVDGERLYVVGDAGNLVCLNVPGRHDCLAKELRDGFWRHRPNLGLPRITTG